MTPLVSVLVINYNYGRFLSDALASVRLQTFSDYEVLVADDGSTDNSADICDDFVGLDVRFITGPHVGLAFNLQRGLNQCDGELVAFLSADDVWLPDHLAACISALDRLEFAAVAYSSCQPIDETGRVIVPPPTARRPRSLPSGWIDARTLLPGQFIPTQAAVVTREALTAIGGFDTSLHYAELDLFVRLAARYQVVYTGRATAQYRIHALGMSRDHQRALEARLALYDKHLPGGSEEKRRLVARAHAKTAYRQVRQAESVAALRAARANIATALRISPRSALRPLNAAVLAATCMGRGFLYIGRFYERHLRERRRIKLALQRLLLMDR
jgi:glycosyltransferase involved in cell wall biosynthesis